MPITNAPHEQVDEILSKFPDIKIVSPLRDPYLSYLTRLRYDLPHSNEGKQIMINYWKTFIEKMMQYPIVFVPVDCAEHDRPKVLHSVARHLGAQVPKFPFAQFVNEWPKVGTKGDNEMKDEYVIHGTIDGKQPTFLDFASKWVKAYT